MPLHEKINYCCCLYVLTLTLSQAWYEGLCVPCLIWLLVQNLSCLWCDSRFVIEYREPRESNKFYKDLVSPRWMADIAFACKSDLPGPLGGKDFPTKKECPDDCWCDSMTLKWRSHHHKDVFVQPFEDTILLVSWIHVFDGEKG